MLIAILIFTEVMRICHACHIIDDVALVMLASLGITLGWGEVI